MKLLIHTCCAPCLISPLEDILSQNIEVILYFNNPNIQDKNEYELRLNSVLQVAKDYNLELIQAHSLEDYQAQTELFFASAKTHTFPYRCIFCYSQRMQSTAKLSAKLNIPFTSTLLYSKYQQHDAISRMCKIFAKKENTNFHYEDYRKFWQQGIDRSKELAYYRQKYCGCLFSKLERDQAILEKKAIAVKLQKELKAHYKYKT